MIHTRPLVRIFLIFIFFASSITAVLAQQCSATTKKGTQCKRNATSGSSYCWQHGGSTSSSAPEVTKSTPPPRANVVEAPTDTSKSSKVAVSRTGKKYHRESCSYLRGGYSMISLDTAKESYSPCSKCKP
jgi:hypothetical protein